VFWDCLPELANNLFDANSFISNNSTLVRLDRLPDSNLETVSLRARDFNNRLLEELIKVIDYIEGESVPVFRTRDAKYEYNKAPIPEPSTQDSAKTGNEKIKLSPDEKMALLIEIVKLRPEFKLEKLCTLAKLLELLSQETDTQTATSLNLELLRKIPPDIVAATKYVGRACKLVQYLVGTNNVYVTWKDAAAISQKITGRSPKEDSTDVTQIANDLDLHYVARGNRGGRPKTAHEITRWLEQLD